jgi:peptidoglycan/LPS O-acetylase OafA/YrhL
VLYYDLGGKDADWASTLFRIPHNAAEYTLGLGFGFGLVMAGTMASRLVSRVVGVYPLRFLGTVSYSVFLVHPLYILAAFPHLRLATAGQVQPFIVALGQSPWWFGFFAFAPGVLLWAAVTYLVVERPFLMMRPRQIRPESGGVLTFPQTAPAVMRPAA